MITESWLNSEIPDSAVAIGHKFQVYRHRGGARISPTEGLRSPTGGLEYFDCVAYQKILVLHCCSTYIFGITFRTNIN